MTKTLDLLQSRAGQFDRCTALCIREGDGWNELTYGELASRVRRVASAIIESGIRPGDRVALLSESRPEWAVAFFATVHAGAVVVPLDVKLTPGEIDIILKDCAPRMLFVSKEQAGKAAEIDVPSIESTHLLQSLGQLVPKADHPSRERAEEETAVIIYTSGTTGAPKGVMVSYANLLFQVEKLESALDIGPGDAVLSILPLNHLLELTAGFLAMLNKGCTICYSNSLHPHEIVSVLAEKQVRTMIGVPLFFKALKTSIEKQLAKQGWIKRTAFETASKVAAVVPGGGRRFLFRAIHDRLGGGLRAVISGGAPLDPEIEEFFERIGLPILQGYGLTETSPVITFNTVDRRRAGTVGRPLDGIEVRIAKDGEILTRGPHVMQGYYGRDDLTREVLDEEGWLHTGDIGELDADGFLRITGRIKSMIVLGGGKKVHPEEVEVILSRSPRIKEVCVLGWSPEGHERVCAVAVPADGVSAADVESDISERARDLAPYKRPWKVILHPGELPKTPSRKVRRRDLVAWLKEAVHAA